MPVGNFLSCFIFVDDKNNYLSSKNPPQVAATNLIQTAVNQINSST
jgi:hypothetical protein